MSIETGHRAVIAVFDVSQSKVAHVDLGGRLALFTNGFLVSAFEQKLWRGRFHIWRGRFHTEDPLALLEEVVSWSEFVFGVGNYHVRAPSLKEMEESEWHCPELTR